MYIIIIQDRASLFFDFAFFKLRVTIALDAKKYFFYLENTWIITLIFIMLLLKDDKIITNKYYIIRLNDLEEILCIRYATLSPLPNH